jgi:hypothetical protein
MNVERGDEKWPAKTDLKTAARMETYDNRI